MMGSDHLFFSLTLTDFPGAELDWLGSTDDLMWGNCEAKPEKGQEKALVKENGLMIRSPLSFSSVWSTLT